ncbi:MAG: ketopantoate reductase C-terminal domain-containing protein, partial [Stellaceae bacterium]
EIDHLPPETIARAGEGDAAALRIYDERRLSRVGRGSPDQRPSMGQDMAKGRRTEIEYLNGFVVREGEQVGIQARANERLVEIVKRVERGELPPWRAAVSSSPFVDFRDSPRAGSRYSGKTDANEEG